MSKKFTFNPAEAAAAGSAHRTGELGSLDKVIRASSRKPTGRKPNFPGEKVARLNVFLPETLVRTIKAKAAERGKTLSQFVADWAKSL
jgi:hypothetical protein